ncbi:MAG: LCP family protein [Clostridiales bacterium]|nr:LCP family protein [Clostridiales bacterium]
MKEERKAGSKDRSNSFFRRNNYRNLIILLLIILTIFVTVFVISYTWVKNKLDKINIDSGFDFSNQDDILPTEEPDPDFQAMHDIDDASSLTEFLKEWANNGGEKMYSKDVLNILLCGVDSADGTISGGRSDAMIMVSINKNTKKITMVSFFRDSYTYMNINGKERYYKVNGAYNWGGPATLVKILEDNYKIRIDYYISVDFVTFPKLIDALGGVELEVKEYEAKYIDRTTHTMTRKFPYGSNVRIYGKEALVYSRIRHCDSDSDISRTRRHRNLISAIIKSAKGASLGQINNALDQTLGYVRTNMKRNEILSYVTQALTQKWMDYEIVGMTMPDVETGGTGVSATINKEFVWIVDYSRAAQDLQNAIYGKTNIELDNNSERKRYINSLFNNTDSSSSKKKKEETTTEPVTKRRSRLFWNPEDPDDEEPDEIDTQDSDERETFYEEANDNFD